MSGTSAHVAPSTALALPAPKLRARSMPGGPTQTTLHDGTQVAVTNPAGVVLDEIPEQAFDAVHQIELRLYRYGRAKPVGSTRKNPARWAACRHIEGGVNPYDSSQWLGGQCADGQDRTSRVLLAGHGYGDVVDITGMWSSWLKMSDTTAATAAGNVTVPMPMSTWMHHRKSPTRSYGISGNTEPVRFAVAYVGVDSETGRWQRMSSLSRFMIGTKEHPWVWDAASPANIQPTPTDPGVRVFTLNPNYDPKLLTVRVTESEWLAGGR